MVKGKSTMWKIKVTAKQGKWEQAGNKEILKGLVDYVAS